MRYTVVITETAKQDLLDIALWIVEQSKDVTISKCFVNELKEKCQKLDMFPNSGALPKDRTLKSLGYRYIIHKDYLIFYCIEEEKQLVNILAIFNSMKNYIQEMKKYI